MLQILRCICSYVVAKWCSFKYFAIIKFSRKTNTLVAVDLLAGFCICTWKKLIKAKKIFPLTLFFNFFSDTKTYFKSSFPSCLIKKQSIKPLGYSYEIVLESLFNKVAGLQDCYKTYLLYSHLRFYLSLRKNVMMELFCKNSEWLVTINYFCKNAPS